MKTHAHTHIYIPTTLLRTTSSKIRARYQPVTTYLSCTSSYSVVKTSLPPWRFAARGLCMSLPCRDATRGWRFTNFPSIHAGNHVSMRCHATSLGSLASYGVLGRRSRFVVWFDSRFPRVLWFGSLCLTAQVQWFHRHAFGGHETGMALLAN